MWGLFSNGNFANDLLGECMSEAYRKKSLSINLAFFLLILASFTFINLIFIKNISNMDNEIKQSSLISHSSIQESQFSSLNKFLLLSSNDDFTEKLSYQAKNHENKIILFGLNLIFFLIVIYTIGSFTFTVKSMKSIENQFIDQLEKNKELKKHFKEKSRYIRHKFKRKLIDIKSKKNIFVNSIKGFLDEHMGEIQSSMYSDEYKSLKLNLHMNSVGTWSWDVKKDIVQIDNASYSLLSLDNKAFAGGYSLFLNFFDRASRRRLKRDIAYALKHRTAFETRCSIKTSINSKGLLLKGNLVYDSENKAQKIQGIIMQTECPVKTSNIQKQFLNQPLAMFAILDRDFCFEFLNPAWLEHTGYSIHELRRNPMFNFIHQREKRIFLNNLHVLRQDNDASIRNLRYRFRLSDGNFLKMNFTISYENSRFYILANSVEKRKKDKKVEFDFNLQESWDQQYLKS